MPSEASARERSNFGNGNMDGVQGYQVGSLPFPLSTATAMRNALRLSIGTLALAFLAACSNASEQPLPDDLKQDLARLGGGDVQLAGAALPKLEFVSSSERIDSPAPSPKAKTVSRAPSAKRGTSAAVKSARRESPAVQESVVAEDAAPVQEPQLERVPEPVPASSGRPEAPRPSTQREPPGGWRSPSSIIRNAPFPINP